MIRNGYPALSVSGQYFTPMRIIAKCGPGFDKKFDKHELTLIGLGLRPNHDGTYEGRIKDEDMFRLITNSPDWTDYWTFQEIT